MVRPQRLPELLILALICVGFGGAILAYRLLFPDLFDFLTSDELVLGFVTCVGTFWVAVRLTDFDGYRSDWLPLANAFCIGTGINLIIQAWLNYLEILTRSMFLIVVGGVFASALLWIARQLMPSRGPEFQAHTVMVGFDPASAELIRLLPYPLAAIVSDHSDPSRSRSLPYEELESALASLQPRQIVVTPRSAGHVNPATLLAQRLRGASVNSTSELYEELLGRVCCAGRQPVDLLLSRSLAGNQQAMVFQSIYTNLIALCLLIVVSPVLALAIAASLAFGAGSVIESEECCGFENIPFLRLRFRTRRPDGTYPLAGKLIERFHLTDLPLLFNIIRGEMALFGPRPVRREFADRLTELLPFYSMRFAVKPGLVDWGTTQARRPHERTSVLTEIEYDLYYVKYGSPLLDFEILMRLLLPARQHEDPDAEFASAV